MSGRPVPPARDRAAASLSRRMSPVRSLRLRPLAALLALVAVAGLAGLNPGAARADRLAEARAEADRVEAELQGLNDQVAAAAEAYNAAQIELDQTNAAIEENQRILAASKSNLRISRRELEQMLVDAYRRGDPDLLAFLLSANSIDELVDQSRFMQRITVHAGQIVRDVRRYTRQVRDTERALEAERADRAAALDARAAEEAAVRGALAERQDLLASLSGEISAIIERRELARRAEAERLAAAAGITLEEAVAEAGGDDVAIGGSADIGSAGAVIEAPPSSTVGGSAASIALGALGIPYVWAGSTPESGFDCSGLISWAYAQVGVSLPHNAAAIYAGGTPVPLEALEPGDIVSFHGSGHAGIYIGGGQYVHAPQTGDVVKVSSLSDRSDIDGAVRVS